MIRSWLVRSSVVPVLASPFLLLGICAESVYANPTVTVVSTVVSPSAPDNGTAVGSRLVDVATKHEVKVTGGTPNGKLGISYSAELSVDGEIYASSYVPSPANPNQVILQTNYDANGEFKQVGNLAAKPSLIFADHVFKATTDAAISGGGSTSDPKEKTIKINLNTSPPITPTDPPTPGGDE